MRWTAARQIAVNMDQFLGYEEYEFFVRWIFNARDKTGSAPSAREEDFFISINEDSFTLLSLLTSISADGDFTSLIYSTFAILIN